MAITLHKTHDQPTLAADTDHELEWNIPDGETWVIRRYEADSDRASVLAVLEYSDDNGVTWTNPWDSSVTFIKKLHVTAGPPSFSLLEGIEFVGGVGIKLRSRLENNNSVNPADCSAYINGVIRN